MLLKRREQDLWPVRRAVMAALAAERAVLAIQEHALANVRLHVALGGLCKFAGAIAKRTIRVGNLYQTSAGTNWAFLNIGLSHLLFLKSTII